MALLAIAHATLEGLVPYRMYLDSTLRVASRRGIGDLSGKYAKSLRHDRRELCTLLYSWPTGRESISFVRLRYSGHQSSSMSRDFDAQSDHRDLGGGC